MFVGGGVMPESRIGQFLPEQHEYLVATYDMPADGRELKGYPLSVSKWIMGFIDLTTGVRSDVKDILIWMPTEEEQRDASYKDVFPNCRICRVRCHPPVKYKGMLSGMFLTEIISTNEVHPFLGRLIHEYLESKHLYSEMFGDMQAKDEYEAYSARFDWLGTEIEVVSSAEYTNYTEPLGYLEEFCREAERHDRELREFAARELIGQVREKLGTSMTEEELARAMTITCVDMYFGGSYDVFFRLGEYEIDVGGDTKGIEKVYMSKYYE